MSTSSMPRPPLPPPPPESYPAQVHVDVRVQRRKDVWTVVFWFRILCAFCCLTFFQPDEYFQSLEPAWQMVLGLNSGAWITWEWAHRLRSALHPTVIAAVYQATSLFLWTLGFPFSIRTQVLVIAPRLFHSTCTALMDYATWRLAARIFGEDSAETTAAIVLSFLSPWQAFAGPRSLANGLEAFLTTLALVHWPWSWITKAPMSKERPIERESIRYAVVFAVLASVLRPTNVIIWALLFLALLPHSTAFELLSLAQDAVIYGSAVLAFSLGLDRLYYGVWTFPAAQFLRFNLAEDLAVFYGSNRVDYYFTEGLPILLTVALPFALVGIYQALTNRDGDGDGNADSKDHAVNATTRGASHFALSRSSTNLALRALAIPTVAYPIILSLISHKEVRFLYPLLAPLLIIAARPFATYFHPLPWPARGGRQLGLVLFTLSACAIAAYASLVHQRGPASVLSYLRQQFIYRNADALTFGTQPFYTPLTSFFGHTSLLALLTARPGHTRSIPRSPLAPMSAAFLMPCHSTPWRSHLAFPELRAWALTCEPPVGLPPAARAAYVDEADVFYADPAAWLRAHMGPLPRRGGGPYLDHGPDWRDIDARVRAGRHAVRAWPRHVAFFAQLEPVLREVLGDDSLYEECWRGFNSHFHDDWRRRGDVVVYCIGGSLDPARLKEGYDEFTVREWEEGQARKIEEMERKMSQGKEEL